MNIQQKLFQAGSFLQYWLLAVNEHALHPPFAYTLYTKVVKQDNLEEEAFQKIEVLRKQLRQDHTVLNLKELGAGSGVRNRSYRTVADIARHSLTTPRFSRLLFRLIRHLKALYVIELGTSIGLNSLYLSTAAVNGQLFTFEGCPQTAATASRIFKQWPLQNIHLKEGNIDETLPELLKNIPSVDAAYLDANHTYEATLRYFGLLLPCLHKNSVVIVDDIYWSAAMKKAWQEIRQHPQVSLSIDLYDAGLLFFRPGLQKAHYVLEF